MGTTPVQGYVWGDLARNWADVQEGQFIPLFREVLEKTGVGPGSAVLDIGCGSGLFCQLGAGLGARVSGLDVSEPMLAIARERSPQGDFRTGDMMELPFADRSFDLAAGFNSFQFAASPLKALQEAGRVIRPGGAVVIATFGRPADCEARAYIAALGALLPAPPAGGGGPFALSTDGALEALAAQVGFKHEAAVEVDVPWIYSDDPTALRGLMASGPALMAVRHVGEVATRETVLRALAPFKTPSGGYHLKNKARYLIARV